VRISIASYSFHGLKQAGIMDVFGYLESCRYRYHLDAADLWNGLLGSDPKVYLDPEFLANVRRAMDERGLACVNYHADGCHIWEDDAARREANYRLALEHLRAAEALGARTVRIDAGSHAAAWTEEQFAAIVARYREYAAIAAKAGFRVGPENHWGPEKNPAHLERLARAVQHPAFGILLHAGRWDGAGDEEGDRRVLGWVVHTHITPAVADERLEAALRMLLEAGYRGYWGIEIGDDVREYEEVEYRIAQVRRALAKIRSESPALGA
jgi:hypothetical protein